MLARLSIIPSIPPAPRPVNPIQPNARRRALRGIVLAAAALAAPARAQEPADTARVYSLQTVVVAAERVPAPLVTSTATVSVLGGAELRRLPLRGLGEALRRVPGFAVIDPDGTGRQVRPIVRGFYGGGEAEYLTLLVDGVPVGAPHTGLVDWDLVPLAAVRSVEVVRGGASSLYGDAAIGGVVNVVTGLAPGTHHLRATAGGAGALALSAAASGRAGGVPVSGWINLDRGDGFRDHAESAAHGAGLSASLLRRPDASLTLSALHRGHEYDEPGPLTGPELAGSRTGSSPLYRFDRAEESLTRAALHADRVVRAAHLSATLSGELRDADGVRTLVLAPGFADTKRRAVDANRLAATALLDAPGPPLPWSGRVAAGVEGSATRFRSDYFALLMGDPGAYAAAPPPGAGTPDEAGLGTREAAAAFLRWDLHPAAAVRLSLGGRMDWLRDEWSPRAPSDPATAASAEHTAFSPRAGINVRYADGPVHQGALYANVGRSFKAATPDQLFDRRTIPVPFEPFRITVSNPELRPQYGTGYEVGAYHGVALAPGAAARLSLAAYRMDMRGELDFDVESFRYVNLGASRHQGVEAGVDVASGGWTGFAAVSAQRAEQRRGEHRGRALKAVPGHALHAGVDAPLPAGATLGLSVTGTGRAWLDDANTQRLPGWTRLDARVTVPLRGVRVWVEGFNLLGREYTITGYPDSVDPSVVYAFPAPGRTLQVGLSTGN
ncbi:MAG TPA: TonB-dependent receptor [Longimicrobium sp.]|nr:TonB-dependent receptor [Longimicrobium sp.]